MGVSEEEASSRLFDTVDLAVACLAALTYLPLDVKNEATIKGKNQVAILALNCCLSSHYSPPFLPPLPPSFLSLPPSSSSLLPLPVSDNVTALMIYGHHSR